jgi:hypothetical protein
MNKEIYINYHSFSKDKEAYIWHKVSDFENPEEVEEFFEWFEIEIKLIDCNIEKSQLLARALIKDLLELKGKNAHNEDLIDFLQYIISVSILRIVTSNKILNYCYDWICNSLSRDLPESLQREYEPNRIVAFFASKNVFIKKNIDLFFLTWSECIFYYSRCTGGHIDLCKIYLDIYFIRIINLFTQKLFLEELIPALANISTWCFIHKNDSQNKIASEILFKLYNLNISPLSKKMIAVNFSCRKNSYNLYSKKEWCDIIITTYLDILHPHEHLQIYANKFEDNVDQLIENLDVLFLSFDEYYKYLDAHDDDFKINYELSRLYSNLLNSICLLIQNGKTEIASEIICRYFRIDYDSTFSKNILFILPNTESGVFYSVGKSQIITDTNTFKNIPQIITFNNQFFSTTNTLHDYSDFQYESPRRLGAPLKEKANQFLEAIKKHFDFNQIIQIPRLSEINGMHLFYGIQLPIQSIISKELKIIIPLIQSFEKPNKQRKINKVLIWDGDTMLSQIECIGINDIFQNKGIETVVLNFETSSKQDFLENYYSDDYDLIWICCHGEFDHWATHKSYLNLGNEIHLNLEELDSSHISTKNRRLVVLDACDGATTSLINSPLSLGIGSALVCSEQSLISHQWPIDNYSALISGTILATYLSDNLDYSESLNNTINLFYSGKELTIERVKQYCNQEEVIDRIENTTIDFKNFYSWGSLVYLV